MLSKSFVLCFVPCSIILSQCLCIHKRSVYMCLSYGCKHQFLLHKCLWKGWTSWLSVHSHSERRYWTVFFKIPYFVPYFLTEVLFSFSATILIWSVLVVLRNWTQVSHVQGLPSTNCTYYWFGPMIYLFGRGFGPYPVVLRNHSWASRPYGTLGIETGLVLVQLCTRETPYYCTMTLVPYF